MPGGKQEQPQQAVHGGVQAGRGRAGPLLRQDQADRGQGAPGELTTAEREELRRLRRQNREQAETIELLRKAAVFFAKESDR